MSYKGSCAGGSVLGVAMLRWQNLKGGLVGGGQAMGALPWEGIRVVHENCCEERPPQGLGPAACGLSLSPSQSRGNADRAPSSDATSPTTRIVSEMNFFSLNFL